MNNDRESGSHYVACVTGVLRVVAFLGLIAATVPVHLVYGWKRPNDPFRIPQFLHSMIVRVLGFHVRVHGTIATRAPVLFVSNHSSYLDIPILGSLMPSTFVAKAEVASWPFFGLLAKMQHTVFIERRAAVIDHHRDDMLGRLAKGQNLVLFPEGTSTDGMKVLPFKSGLFAAVEDPSLKETVTVQPISVTCTGLDGLPITRAGRPFYAWYGDMTFPKHLWNVFKYGRFTVDVVFHTPVSPSAFANRKALAAYCQQEVARGIEQCLTGRAFAPQRAVARLTAPA